MRSRTIVTAMVLGLAACNPGGSDRSGSGSGDGGKADDPGAVDTRGYHFVDHGKFTTRRDHAGAPLLATIWGRLSDYDVDAPFVETAASDAGKPWLLHITERFHTVHSSWAPSFEDMGLDSCDDLGIDNDLFDAIANLDFKALKPEQCFGQRMRWPDPDRRGQLVDYRRTIEVSLPDYLTIEFDRAAAFPNGRVLHEQINSLMFAMAFLDQGGECTDESGAAVECDLHTLWRRSDFLKPQNDVPFRGNAEIGAPTTTFPFLADPHEM